MPERRFSAKAGYSATIATGVMAEAWPPGRSGPKPMKTLPATPALLRVARRVVWYEESEKALGNPVHFRAEALAVPAGISILPSEDDEQRISGILDPFSELARFHGREPGMLHIEFGEVGMAFIVETAPDCDRLGPEAAV